MLTHNLENEFARDYINFLNVLNLGNHIKEKKIEQSYQDIMTLDACEKKIVYFTTSASNL